MADHAEASPAPIWAVTAEFGDEAAMVGALHALHAADLGRLDAFSPVPVPGAAEAMKLPRQPIHPFALLGALLGGGAMFGMCTYALVVSYRFNVGGRPQFAWPAFLVPSVSAAMMGGALVALGALLVLNRLPRLNHPAFNIPGFGRATNDRFFVAVEGRDEHFDPARVESALAALALRPLAVSRVQR